MYQKLDEPRTRGKDLEQKLEREGLNEYRRLIWVNVWWLWSVLTLHHSDPRYNLGCHCRGRHCDKPAAGCWPPWKSTFPYPSYVWCHGCLYLLLRCKPGSSALSSACPLCSFRSRCVSSETRWSRDSARSPWDKAPHRWPAWAEWRRGTAAFPHILLDGQKRISLLREIDPWPEQSDWTCRTQLLFYNKHYA